MANYGGDKHFAIINIKIQLFLQIFSAAIMTRTMTNIVAEQNQKVQVKRNKQQNQQAALI